MLSSHGGYLTIAMQHNTETILSNGETKSRAHDPDIVGAKEDLKLSHGGPSQRQASDTNLTFKAFRQSHH